MTERQSKPLTKGDLNDLARTLDQVTTDLVDRLAIASEPWSRLGISGPHVQSQPCSRPPYNLGAEIILEELRNELTTTVRHMCEHRAIDVPAVNSLVAAAGWIRKHRVAIAVMPDGHEIVRALTRAVDHAVRSVGVVEQEYRIPKIREQVMVATANQHQVDAGRIEKLAHKLGDQAKGLNRNRVDYLRRTGRLVGEWDETTGKWWYLLGDVLAAHKRARESRGKVQA